MSIKQIKCGAKFFPFKALDVKVIGVMLFGNFLEIFEFSLYGIFSKTFSNVFFNNSRYSLFFSLAIFSCGFFARPFGAVIFGHIGDKYGRRPSLIFSIILMTVATFGIGILPTSDKIGLLAPILLLTLRIVQGIACGGEYIGITVYLFERYSSKTGLAGSLAAVSGMSGTLVAIFISLMVCSHISLDWNWRIPFLISPVFGLLAIYLRIYFTESNDFLNSKSKNTIKKIPIKEVFNKYSFELISNIFIGGCNGVLTFTLIAYLNVFLLNNAPMNLKELLSINFSAVCFFILSGLSLGIIKDKYNLSANSLLILISVMTFILSPFMYDELLAGTYSSIIRGQIILGILAGCFSACCNVCMCQLFPSEVRYSGVAFGYSIGVSLLGGTVPTFSQLLIKITGQPYMAFLYLSLGSLIGIWGCLIAMHVAKAKKKRQTIYATDIGAAA